MNNHTTRIHSRINVKYKFTHRIDAPALLHFSVERPVSIIIEM